MEKYMSVILKAVKFYVEVITKYKHLAIFT